MKSQKTITFTSVDLGMLKRAYGKAVKENKKQFVFKGAELLTAYAKYLIEYLDSKLK